MTVCNRCKGRGYYYGYGGKRLPCPREGCHTSQRTFAERANMRNNLTAATARYKREQLKPELYGIAVRQAAQIFDIDELVKITGLRTRTVRAFVAGQEQIALDNGCNGL